MIFILLILPILLIIFFYFYLKNPVCKKPRTKTEALFMRYKNGEITKEELSIEIDQLEKELDERSNLIDLYKSKNISFEEYTSLREKLD